jgi:hypothetical protein
LERWITEQTRIQIEMASIRSREVILEDRAALPDDEERWFDYDAGAVFRLLSDLPDLNDEDEVEPRLVEGALLALEESLKWADGSSPINLTSADDRGDPASTVGHLRGLLQQAATTAGVFVEQALADARDEADAAELFQTKRAARDDLRDQLRVARAAMLNDADMDQAIRYGAHLDREFTRVRKAFEETQQARTGLLTPTVRLQLET